MVVLVATMFAFWVAFFMWPVGDYIKSIEGNKPFRVGGIRELRLLAKSYNKLYMSSAAEKTELLIRAESDSLTGLMNQRAFFQLKDELKDDKDPLALLVIDIDRFKQINDEYGHDMGDSMLKLVASELLKITNEDDRVIRLGGDEFVVVILNITLAEADRVKQKISLLNENLMRPEPGRPLLSVSVGAAFSDKGYNDELFHRADQAMYSVKRKGGGGLRVYDGTENVRVVIENGNTADKKQKILLVDDSALNREFLSDILHEKYDVVAVENGFRAMDELESEGNSFCLILLDLLMPECDGFQVLDYMKKYRWSEILPVIVISAENDPTLITRAYDMGIMDYISRPFAANVVLKRVDNTVSLYLRHKRLAGLVFQQIQEQVDSYDRVLQALSHIVEFRGDQRPSHIKHIDLITELLLDALMKKTSRYALTASDARRIRRASVLHDIGKIAIPEEILNKVGGFTKEDFEIVKKHSLEGARILESLGNVQDDKFLLTAYEICRYHHERYDGRGYPDGLKGDDIPISAQIVSIADVYDALTSDRCYKKACTHEEALKMIYGGECGVFNPILIECLNEIADVLPLRLSESTDVISRRRENEYFAEEFYRHDEFTYTNRFLTNARFEAVKSEFFCKATTDRTFFYRADTEELTLSPETAELLGVAELVIRKPLETLPNKTNILDKASIATLKEYFSPQSPETSMTVNVKSAGAVKKYRVVVKSVWTNDTNPRCLGVVGFFQPA